MDLIDLASGRENNWSFVFAAQNMLELVDTVTGMYESGMNEVYIPLGDIAILGQGQAQAQADSANSMTPEQAAKYQALLDDLDELEQKGRGKRGSWSHTKFGATPRAGFKLHIFELGNWAKLLSGGEADRVLLSSRVETPGVSVMGYTSPHG